MLETLEKYYNDGLLFKQTHPTKDLTIWNYSQKVQYERLWDEITLMCRGLVTNSKGEIIARPFKKFFNYEEYLELAPHLIPTNESFEVFDKMDGSLGILFYYDKEWILCTRGSFTSDQAIKGMEILLSKYNLDKLSHDHTYLFEIIYPENRIVIQYNDEKLVLLSIIHTNSGEEVSYENMVISTIHSNVPFVKRYNGIEDYSKLKSMISNDEEGYVIRFKNGFRMKIKGEEYCRLHKILTNISNRDIWSYLREGKSMNELIEKVPDEFFDWVKETIKDFESKFEVILGEVITDFWEIDSELTNEQIELGDNLTFDEKTGNKKFAEKAFKRKYPHLLFSYRKEMLNPKNTNDAIWRMIYPKYQKAFKKNDDE